MSKGKLSEGLRARACQKGMLRGACLLVAKATEWLAL